MSLAFSECKKCKLNKIGYICPWEDKFNYNCKNFTSKEKKKIAEEMLKPIDEECDIRHTCGKMDKGSYICDMLKEIEKELNIE